MKVLIIEPHVSGHHGPYLAWMVEALAKQGFEIKVVTLKESIEHPSLNVLREMSENNDNVDIHLISSLNKGNLSRIRKRSFLQLMANEFSYWWKFRSWYKSLENSFKPDVVYLPYLDYCLHAIGLLGSPFNRCPWVGLTMRPLFHCQEMGIIAPKPKFSKIRSIFLFRLLKGPYLRQLMTVDESLYEYLLRKSDGTGKCTFLPEPYKELDKDYSAEESKRVFDVPEGRLVILLYGGITLRKGVIELLNALADPAFPANVNVLIAGKVSQEVREELNKPWIQSLLEDGRLQLSDRFIEEEEEPILFAAADLIWLGYRGHFNSSNILVQAAKEGLPVLACEEGIIGWQTRRHGLGQIINPANTDSVINGVNNLINDVSMKHYEASDPPVGSSLSEAESIIEHALLDSEHVRRFS